MKKFIFLTLFLIFCVVTLLGCAQTAETPSNNVISNQDFDSDLFTDEEIEDAMKVVIDHFNKEFKGCTLTELKYIGDDELTSYKKSGVTIVLVSSFDVGSSPVAGGLDINTTYTNWKWILDRKESGQYYITGSGY